MKQLSSECYTNKPKINRSSVFSLFKSGNFPSNIVSDNNKQPLSINLSENNSDTFTESTDATTPKFKYANSSELQHFVSKNSDPSFSMDETMKCIPEVSETDVEVLQSSGFENQSNLKIKVV